MSLLTERHSLAYIPNKNKIIDAATLDCIQVDRQKKKEKTSTWCAEYKGPFCLDTCFRDHHSLKEFKNKYEKILKKVGDINN